jgi:Zn-dependent M16 (insulinase) family peptidase
MKPEDINKIKADALALLQNQEAKEDVSTLPTLEISDISKGVNIITGSQNTDNGIYYYNKPCSGIFYLNIAAGAGMLDEKSLPLLPFFSYAFTKLGNKKRSHEELAKAIATYTGGIGLFPTANTIYQKQDSCLPFILFSAKCLDRNINKMFGITEEIITEFDAQDMERLKTLIAEYKSGLESSIVASGHMLALSLASRHFSKKTALEELWHGVTQFKYIKKISKDLSETKLRNISERLNNIAKTLFVKNNLKSAVIGEDKPLEKALGLAASLKEKLANKTSGFCEPNIEVENSLDYEGWSFPSSVSFAAQTFKTASQPHKDASSLAIIGRILRLLYLHKEIREKGGAYGGMSLYSRQDGIFGFASYRDPHIVSTLNTFEKAGDFIKNKNNYTKEDIKEAILQVCSDIDKPDTPATAAKKAFFRQLIFMPEQARKDFKEQILSENKDKILKTAEKYFNNNVQNKTAVVISGQERLEEANAKLKDKKLKLYKI